ncbi:hypothetical protein BV25DRAFT_1818276 [Artomyces pyxidatus]|uniref:Uncharacterized protein n=1 Tax=Artomyces pyxidatus TaxID=48021 RepID=A0ACB8TLG5_9AGAM|nr:hypothetical protein BV25DRAFT_1818276 [Artomyces pyxidatus]
MTRIAYDAATLQYTFRDEHGELWLGEPGERFGTLVLVQDYKAPERSRGPGRRYHPQAYERPVYFADGEGESELTDDEQSEDSPTPPSAEGGPPALEHITTFGDILPPALIASAHASPTSVFPRPRIHLPHSRAAAKPMESPTEKGDRVVTPVDREYPGEKKGLSLQGAVHVLGHTLARFKHNTEHPRHEEYTQI